MSYFFAYLFIIMLNIFAVLTVLKWRRKKVNDADVISDATIVDEENVNQKKPKKQFSFFNRQQNNNIVVEYQDIEVDKSEVFYDGQLLDIAVKKKIIKKKGNWYLYGCLLYTSPSPRDRTRSRMPSSA